MIVSPGDIRSRGGLTFQVTMYSRENGRHYRIFDLAWRKCRQTIRVVNQVGVLGISILVQLSPISMIRTEIQELLLNRMFELRECDSLLMTNMQDSVSLHDNSLDRSNTSSGQHIPESLRLHKVTRIVSFFQYPKIKRLTPISPPALGSCSLQDILRVHFRRKFGNYCIICVPRGFWIDCF